jgi:hypothetical protein
VKLRLALASSLAIAVFVIDVSVADARLLAFKSPSGNITCVMSTDDPPPFAQCELRSKHRGYFVPYRGRVSFYDVDPFDDLKERRTVLRYGRSLRLSRFVCTSRFAGMRCRNTVSGHGFTISRERQHVF